MASSNDSWKKRIFRRSCEMIFEIRSSGPLRLPPVRTVVMPAVTRAFSSEHMVFSQHLGVGTYSRKWQIE